MIKYGRNCFLSVKVSYFNELFSLCENKKINYEIVRQLIGNDDRIGESHTKVPGHDGKRGYGGTCFPKDINSFRVQFLKAGVPCPVLESSILRNENIDRLNSWKGDIGRAFI